MQTKDKDKTRNVQQTGEYSIERTIPLGHFARRKRAKANKTAGGTPSANFMNKVFRPIPLIRLNPLFTGNNYDFLYKSARNYSKLLGSSFKFKSQKNDFAGLLRYFEKLLPNGQRLALIRKGKKLSFQVRFGYDYLIGEVFYIPIEILDNAEGIFREILLSFFQHFRHTHRFSKKEFFYDYEVIADCYLEECYYEDEQNLEILEFLNAYKDGYIHDIFSLVYQNPNRSTEELEKLIENYTPKNCLEENLLISVKEGVSLIKTGKSIFSYVRHPREVDENFYAVEYDFVIEAERLLRLVYSENDYVTEKYLEFINTEVGEVPNEYLPCQSMDLTPNTDELLKDGFVEHFFSWLMNFIDNIGSIDLKDLKVIKDNKDTKN